LISLILLNGIIVAETKNYFSNEKDIIALKKMANPEEVKIGEEKQF
jgi:hypothetical protein